MTTGIASSDEPVIAASNRILATLSRISTPIWVCVGVVLVALTGYYTGLKPIQFDEAFNFQVAMSLAQHFSYSTIYQPGQVLNPAITTNGAPQYIAAIIYGLCHDPNLTVTIVAMLGMALLAGSTLLLRPWLVAIVFLFFLRWDQFFYDSTSFLGETWAIGFVVLGFVVLKRALKQTEDQKRSRVFFVVATVLFGLAITAKLLVAFAIIPLLLGFFWSQESATGSSTARSLKEALTLTVLMSGAAIFTFLVLVSLSVAHSARHIADLSALPSHVTAFILHHFAIAHAVTTQTPTGPLWAIQHFSNPAILLLAAVASILLLSRSVAYAPFLVVTAILWLHFHFNERQISPFFVLAIVQGLSEDSVLWSYVSERTKHLRLVSMLSAAALIIAFFATSNAANIRFIGTTFEKQAKAGPLRYFVATSRGPYYYHDGLIAAIRKQRVVVTTGWWQYPEMSVVWNLQFYDRINPLNANLNDTGDAALLFDPGNKYWPLTSEASNCASIIYRDGPLVLCRYKRGVPLNFQPKTE